MKFNFENAPLQIIDGDRGENYPKKEEFSNSGYCLFLSTANVTKSGFDFKQCNFISKEKDNALRKGKLVRGDVVLTTRGTIGNSAYYSDQISFDNIRINSGMVIFRVTQEKLLPYYLYLFLNSKDFLSQSESLQSGAAQPQLPIKDIRKLEINIPDLETQKKIASTLSHYDDLIQTNQQRIALLEEAAQRLYDEWFVKLRFPNYQQVPVVEGVPEGWEKVTLSKLVDLINGYPFKPSDLGEEGYPIIKIPELRNGVQATTPRNDGSQIPTKYFVHYGDIIFSWSGTILIDEWGYDKAILNQHLFNVVPYQKERKSFIRLAIQQAIPEMVGHAIGSTMMHLRRGTVDNYELLLPPEMLLNKFCVTVDNLFSQSSILKKQNQKLTQARDELLPRLMSGQLNVIL